jgi:hypothetical protein
VKCGRDCADRPRRKNDKGQYICLECLASLQGGDPGLALADDAPPASQPNAPPRLCAGCGTVMGPGAVICSHCGLNSATGLYIGTGKAPGATGACAKCGYSLAGLKTPVCPECGTVNPAGRRLRPGTPASLFREEWLEPVIYFGVALFLAGLSLLGEVHHIQRSLLVTAAIMAPIATVQYMLCGQMWIGFERPLRFVALRVLAAVALTMAVGLLSGELIVFAFLRYGTMLLALGYALHSLMDIDIGDSMVVSLLILGTTIAIHLTLVYNTSI